MQSLEIALRWSNVTQNCSIIGMLCFKVACHYITSQWCHNERDGVSNHRCLDCLLNYLFLRRSKEISKPHVTGLCEGNPPVTDGFPSKRTSNAENVSIWWHHDQKSLSKLVHTPFGLMTQPTFKMPMTGPTTRIGRGQGVSERLSLTAFLEQRTARSI